MNSISFEVSFSKRLLPCNSRYPFVYVLLKLLLLFNNLYSHRRIKMFDDLAFIQNREEGAILGAKIIRLVICLAYSGNCGLIKFVNGNLTL